MQFRRILQYLLRGLLDVSCLFQHIAGVILVDVLLGERNKRFNIRQLLIALAVINPKGRDDVMLCIARNANGKNLLKRRILRNMLCIEIRTVHGVIGHGLYARVDNARIGPFNLLIHIGFILDDENKITDDGCVFGIPGVAGSTLRSSLQRFVDFLYVAALRIKANLALIKLRGNP